MIKKFLITITVLCVMLLIGTFSYTHATNAENIMRDLSSTMQNATNNVEGSMQNGANMVTEGAQNAGNTIQNAGEAAGNMAENLTNTVANTSRTGTYEATRTATSANNFMSNTWTWVIVGITVAIIAALAWYYMVKRREENF